MGYGKIKIKKSIIIVGLAGMVVGCGILQGSEGATFTKLKVLNHKITKLYIGDISQDKLDEGVYAGYVSGLENPVSSYLSETAYKAQLAYEEGKEVGTGLTYTWGLDGNHLVIINVAKGSPADQVGLQVGDMITQVDDIKVIYSNESTLAKKLSNAGEGTSHTYIVRKKSNPKTDSKITIENKVFERTSLKTDIINRVGYIKIENIKSGTSEEIKHAIDNFNTQGIKKIILDIRDLYTNNLEETVKICDLFMDEGIAFKIKDKSGKLVEYQTSVGKEEVKAAILINNSTSGVVEALPAALKGEIPLIGTNTAGNGYLSKLFSLDDGTGVKLAIGTICTRDNTDISKDGVEVDDQVLEPIESIIELVNEGSMSYESDMQLQAAVKKLQ